MKIKKKLTIMFVVIAMVPLITIGIISFSEAQTALKQQIQRGLEAVTDSRVSNLIHIVRLRQEQAKALSGNYIIRKLDPSWKYNEKALSDEEIKDKKREIKAIKNKKNKDVRNKIYKDTIAANEQIAALNKPIAAANRRKTAVANIKTQIDALYEELQISPGLEESLINKKSSIAVIEIWSVDGDIVASTDKVTAKRKDTTYRKKRERSVIEAMGKGAYFGGYQKDPITGKDYLMFFQSIRQDSTIQDFAGVVVLKVNPTSLDEISSMVDGLGETGEVYLGAKEGGEINLITELRHTKAMKKIIIGSAEALPVQAAVSGENGFGISLDYREKEVIAVWKYIPELKWGIVAKIDTAEAYDPLNSLRNLMLIIGILTLVIMYWIATKISLSFTKPIVRAARIAEEVALGYLDSEIDIEGSEEVNELGLALTKMQQTMQQTANSAIAAAKGDFEQEVDVKSEKDDMAIAVNKMMVAIKEKIWIDKGIRETADALAKQNELTNIAENIINQLVPYLNAQVGALYVYDNTSSQLIYTAGYACDRKGKKNYNLKIGEGLAGQAAKEKTTILFTDIPKDYLTINSSLGEVTPKNILILPILFLGNKELKGVIEIGSIYEFSALQQQLLEKIGETIANAINMAQARIKVQELLEESQAQNEELQTSAEELQASTEEVLNQQTKLAIVAVEADAVKLAVDTGWSSIEFTIDGTILKANDNFISDLGYASNEELVGKHHSIFCEAEYIKSDDYKTFWKNLADGKQQAGEFKRIRKDGSEIWINANYTPVLNAQGELFKVIKIANDISVQMEQKETLAKQTEELKESNVRELQKSNMKLEEQTEKLQASEEELRVQQEELLQTNNELEEKGQMLEENNISVNEKNKALETARLELQTKAKELEQTSRYKSEFLANMSHELRTPLNSILLLSKLMSDNTDENLTEDQIEFSKVIHTSGNGLLELINEILDLSKIESGKMDLHLENVKLDNLKTNLSGMFAPIVAGKDINLNFNIDKEITEEITTDRIRLEQVLKNLLSNAVKFTEAGSVDVRIYEPSKRINFTNSTLTPGEVIAFEVKDSGIGIPKEKLQLVFEPFQQVDGSTRRKYGGTGLGLSISREIAAMLGGELALESIEGEGSTFTLYLPIEGSAAILKINETVSTEAELQEPQLKNVVIVDPNIMSFTPDEIPDDRHLISEGDKVILIVEDDTNFAQALVRFARDRGYKAVVSVSGATALNYAIKYQPTGILLDIQLPVKSGWGLMSEFKECQETKHIPVHMMSSLEVRRKESVEAGAIDFIEKPLAEEQVKKALDKLSDIAETFPKKILLIEDSEKHQLAMKTFLGDKNKEFISAYTVDEGMEILDSERIDCVILDMGLPGETGYQFLERIKKQKRFETLPVIIYTGKSLSLADEKKLEQYGSTIVIKTVDSYQRLINEVTLFLHLIEDPNDVLERKNRKPYITEVSLSKKKVLVVDDDSRNVFSLTKVLENQKMTVISAGNGKDAIKILKDHPDTTMILMDMMMPEMDGYETMIILRKDTQWKKTPIIAITAKAMLGDRQKCIEAGASDYISKPVDSDQLISLLRVWLNKR